MAIKDSVTSGNWGSSGTWDSGVPGNNDIGRINEEDIVKVAVEAQAMGWILNGGSLIFDADFVFTDTPSAGFSIKDVNSGGVSFSGSPGAWRKLRSENTIPTNPWTPEVLPIAGYDKRDLNFDFVEFQGCYYYLGNTDQYVYFNEKSKNEYLTLETIHPPMPDSNLLEHTVKGRTSARVYPGSWTAASLRITGRCKVDSGFPIVVRQMQRNKSRLAFFSRYWHMPRCWIEGKPIMSTQKNAEMVTWDIVLREDV